MRDYLCGVGRYWIEEFDVDGWRLDVASEADDGFWRAFRTACKAAKPDALLIGEVWESARHWLEGDMFDSTMNYDFRRHCLRFFARGELDAAGFTARCGDMLMRYKKQMSSVQLNLLDSHDVPRFLTLCGGDKRRYKLAALFMFSFVGMPMLFYGDELGISGLKELDYRAPMPWDGGDRELLGFIKRAAALRNEHASLRRGDFRVKHAHGGLMVYERRLGSEHVTIALNASDKPEPLPDIAGKPLWADGLYDGSLSSWGFAVYE